MPFPLLIYSCGAHSLVGMGRVLPSLGNGVWMLPTQWASQQHQVY